MAGIFRDLEEELCGFTTHGYTGDHSPNRADAMIWGMSDLFPELCKYEEAPKELPRQVIHRRRTGTEWMHNL
jgi:phage terminase large subunit-like protein